MLKRTHARDRCEAGPVAGHFGRARTAAFRAAAAAGLTILLICSAALAQGTITATDSGGNLEQLGTAWIYQATDFPMPSLSFTLSSVPNSCDLVNWSIAFTYSDADGLAQVASTVPAQDGLLVSQTFQLAGSSWGGNQMGGYATVTAQPTLEGVADGPASTFSFYILGKNGFTQSVLDAYYAGEENSVYYNNFSYGTPWFLPYMITEESNSTDSQFSIYGYPTWGTPDGNGLLQIDRTVQGGYYESATQSPYWDWQTNIDDALAILNADEYGTCPGGTCAYNFYDNQVFQMCNSENVLGIYSGGYQNGPPGTGTCSKVSNSASSAFPDATFAFPVVSGDRSYKDADWLLSYNGACAGYYLVWNGSTMTLNYPATCHGQSNWDYVRSVLSDPAY